MSNLSLLPGIREKELRRLEKIKMTCEICSGSGFIMKSTKGGNIIDDCKCVTRIKNEYDLIKFNIPPKYRNWNLSKLEDAFVSKNKKAINSIKSYIENLDKYIEEGKGLWFNSAPGLAKSSIICLILKTAIKQGYVPYFGRAAYFVDLKFKTMGKGAEREEARNLLKFIFTEVDILAIEEIDKVYLPGKESLPNKLFYEFISEAYDSNISLLVSSNKVRADLEKDMPWFIRDRFSSLKDIPLYWGIHSGREVTNEI